jgi:hypothetical protein
MYDFGDGNGPVRARRHFNPDWSRGGWVAATAKVEATCWVAFDAKVYGQAKILSESSVYGKSSVCGNASLHNKSSIYGESHVSGSTSFVAACIYGDTIILGASNNLYYLHNKFIINNIEIWSK